MMMMMKKKKKKMKEKKKKKMKKKMELRRGYSKCSALKGRLTSMKSTIPEPSCTATVESAATAMSLSVSALEEVSRACLRAFSAARGWHTA